MKVLTIFIILLTLTSCRTSPESLKIETSEKKLLRIAILDSGYRVSKLSHVKFCKDSAKDYTDTGIEDVIGHGTHITNIIADRLKDRDYCIILIKWYDPRSKPDNLTWYTIQAFNYAIWMKADIINYSAGGNSHREDEREIIYQALANDIVVNVAAGNEGNNLDNDCYYYPACYNLKGMNVVGNNKNPMSNYGKIVNKWYNGNMIMADRGNGIMEPMTGTSQACALETVYEALERLK